MRVGCAGAAVALHIKQRRRRVVAWRRSTCTKLLLLLHLHALGRVLLLLRKLMLPLLLLKRIRLHRRVAHRRRR